MEQSMNLARWALHVYLCTEVSEQNYTEYTGLQLLNHCIYHQACGDKIIIVHCSVFKS